MLDVRGTSAADESSPQRQANTSGTVCAMAFGPGLTLEAARMRVDA